MNPVELLNQVSAFYSQAFDKLLAITFGSIGLIGIAVPILVGWVQLKSLRSEKNSLLNELRKELETERDKLRSFAEVEIEKRVKKAEEQYNNRFEKLSEELKIASAKAAGRSFHLQANIGCDKDPVSAVEDYRVATKHYIRANDEANAQRCIEQIIATCLPATDSRSYAREKIEEQCSSLRELLKSKNANSRYTNYIQRLERALDAAKTREPKVVQPKGNV